MAMPHVNSRMGVRPRLIAATTFLICLMPSLVSLGWGFARPTEHTRLPQAEMRPLAMHIHMIHLREFDLREGKAIGRFEFHNAAEAPLKIDRIKPSCGCVTTRLLQPPEGYTPGEAGEFYLEVDTSSESAGPHEYEVMIDYRIAGKEQESSQVVFRVDVPEKKVMVQPRALIFYQFNADPTQQKVTITDFREGYDLELLDLRLEGEFLSVDIPQAGRDEYGHRLWTFHLTVAGAIPSGRKTGYVEIETNDAEYPELRIPVLIYGPPESPAKRD